MKFSCRWRKYTGRREAFTLNYRKDVGVMAFPITANKWDGQNKGLGWVRGVS